MVISCESCVRQDTTTCEECVVTYVLGSAQRGLVLDVSTERAVRLLVAAQLVPALRHRIA